MIYVCTICISDAMYSNSDNISYFAWKFSVSNKMNNIITKWLLSNGDTVTGQRFIFLIWRWYDELKIVYKSSEEKMDQLIRNDTWHHHGLSNLMHIWRSFDILCEMCMRYILGWEIFRNYRCLDVNSYYTVTGSLPFSVMWQRIYSPQFSHMVTVVWLLNRNIHFVP